MSRINTNIQSMVASRVLNNQQMSLSKSLSRLSTGLKINNGKDDPAGLIASETLRAEKVALGAAITNIARANNVISVAESGLDEVNKLLVELEDLVDRSANEAGITDDERAANQLQIDAILDSINRISSSTEFQGEQLLGGNYDYTLSNDSTSNYNSIRVNSARLANNSYRDVVVDITSSAQVAHLSYNASAVSGGTATIEVKGNLGTETLTFASGTTVASVATAVNQTKDLTGVSAVASAGGLQFYSTSYGSEQFVSVRSLDNSVAFNVTGGDAGTGLDYGEDAGVTINGVTAAVKGLTASVNSTSLSIELELTSTMGTTLGSDTFQVTGGGADFMISPKVNMVGLASLGIQSVSTSKLGNFDTGFLSSIASGGTNDIDSGNYFKAQDIVRQAQEQVSFLRGRLGAFQKNTLESTANSLRITLENTTAAESVIRDTDFATETSELTRSQILAQSATNTLRLANQLPQSVLALLG